MSRLCEGRVNTARAAAHFLRETVGRVRYGGVGGQLTVRADRGFYAHAILAVCCEMPVRFSITIRRHARLRNISEAIPETDWTPIPSYLDFGDGADHRRPSTDANCQNLPGQSLLHVHCPPFRHRHHPVRWIRAKGLSLAPAQGFRAFPSVWHRHRGHGCQFSRGLGRHRLLPKTHS